MISSWTQLLPLPLQGARITIVVALLSAGVALVLSIAVGLARLSGLRAIRWLSTIYVEFFRGTSLLIQLFWLYFALPFVGIELPKLLAAVLALGLNYGAYGSEIVRSSILAVPKGQWEAAIALNMKPWQRMLYVIIPQAFVRMLPPLGNLLIELVKGTSLVYFITLADLTYQAMVLRNNYIAWTPQILALLLIMYYMINALIAFAIRLIERKASVGRL
ncbi:ectoine/hydroxyectoine ABC transporter permease subunit EhuC [Paenibacillus puerhi]|uniref:ectoine/hydroxyectoine ABC transporter permease subunit EhuC n=1 Tax=Paenibacillus puerhi TaxID=2692622 RepID=UPI0013598520|nr:ectoine/hydroxyectoine ABC transporter permease subunit EhuC [Paenibacillus puerhi]